MRAAAKAKGAPGAMLENSQPASTGPPMRASAMPLMFRPSISPCRSGGAAWEIMAVRFGKQIDWPMQTRAKPRMATSQTGDSPWVAMPRPMSISPPVSVRASPNRRTSRPER